MRRKITIEKEILSSEFRKRKKLVKKNVFIYCCECLICKANSRPVKYQFAKSFMGVAIVTGASLALNNTKLSGVSGQMTGSHGGTL